MESPSHLTGHVRISGQTSYLSVTDDLTGRDGAYDVVDLFKEVHGILPGNSEIGMRLLAGFRVHEP